MALLPQAKPLNDTLMVVDVSQNLPYQGVCYSGHVPTLATSSTPFCFQTGQLLTTYQLASLMGMDLERVNFHGFTETWFHKKVGLCVYTASFGFAMMALTATPLARLWVA